MNEPNPILVNIAAQVVAAGIYGETARITLALVPVFDKYGRYNLVNWPKEVEEKFLRDAKKGDAGVECTAYEFHVIPLGKNKSWRSDIFTIHNKIDKAKLKRVGAIGDIDKLNAYWRKVMGGAKEKEGFEYLGKALDPMATSELRDPLDDEGRPPEDSSILKENVPDIHGTGRDKGAKELTFERARHIAERLKPTGVKTRPPASADKSLSHQIGDWRSHRIGPWPDDAAVRRLTDAELVAVIEDHDEWDALKGSRERADRFTNARRIYQDTTKSPKKAICALVKAHKALQGRTPLAAALHFSNSKPAEQKMAEDALSEAVAAYRLASRAEADTPPADPERVAFARRRLYAIQGNPSLGRLFCFVIDFQCNVSDLQAAMTGAFPYKETVLDRDPQGPVVLPDAEVQQAYFLLLRFCKDNGPRLWSTAKLRMPVKNSKTKAGHFLPCSREEIDVLAMDPDEDVCADCKDKTACEQVCKKLTANVRDLAVAEQIDGIVDLGQQWGAEMRYQMISLDPIMATAAEDQKTKQREQNAYTLTKVKPLDPRIAAELSDDKNATQRGGGLALADRWRQLHGIGRHVDSTGQKTQYGNSGKEKGPTNIVLDASDLTIGYKLDVGVYDDKVKRSLWRSLMHRTVTYKPAPKAEWPIVGQSLDSYITTLYGGDDAARRDADGGQLQVPAALRDWKLDNARIRTHVAEEDRPFTTAFMEEVIGAWRGDPLGLACGKHSQQLSADDLRINMDYDLKTDAPFTPPRLRFGWSYHFGLRATFAGGISMPLNRALGHYEKSYDGDLVQPPATQKNGPPFTRHERVDAPVITIPDWMFGTLAPEKTYTNVILKGRFPVPQAGRMLVRSFSDPTNRRIADLPTPAQEQAMAGLGFDRRVLLAPPVSLDFAALHDAFLGKIDNNEIEKNLDILEPRVLRGENAVDGDYETKPVDGEKIDIELAPTSKGSGPSVWDKIRVAWRLSKVKSRPKGGLRGWDHRAAWGGFPIYRAKASAGLVKAKAGDPVVKTAAMTDQGEILHRVKGAGKSILGKQLLWSAVGILDNEEEGQSDRSGTAVFRPLSKERKGEIERQPYYPDPAAITLVIHVQVRGEKEPIREAVSVYIDGKPSGPAPTDYPNALPVVLDIVRGHGKRITVNPRTDYAQTPHTPTPGQALSVAYVKVTLAPGEEASIRCWCVPSEVFFAHIWGAREPLVALAIARSLGKPDADAKSLSPDIVEKHFVAGISALTGIALSEDKDAKKNTERTTFAGLAFPPPKRLRALAAGIRERMLKEPIPEIAAVTEIEAVHAVDVPLEAPGGVKDREWHLLRADKKKIDELLIFDCKPTDDPLCDPANWKLENQMSDAIDVLIDGLLTVHGPTTEAVEIRARGTAAARGRFDDVERGRSRDDRARGLWPKPDSQVMMDAKWLFGFEPAEDGSINFKPETVTLLRIEGFAPVMSNGALGRMQLDLLNLQRQAKANPDGTLRASRPSAFPDACARWIEIFAVAISRHAAALRTRYDELPEVLTKPQSPQPGASEEERKNAEIVILDRRWLPATVRPARIVSLSPIPAFAWHDNLPTPATAKQPLVSVTRSIRIRLRAKRPWFSSGEGERLGIVVWPPNLFDGDVGQIQNDMVKPPTKGRKEINLRALPADGTPVVELQDADLGPGGAWVTRWGADPIRDHARVHGWLLSEANFPGVFKSPVFTGHPSEHPTGPALVKNVLMPIPVDADAVELKVAQPPGGFMVVSLVTYTPRFDADQETWYVDVVLDPCNSPYPFVRLGLVRFQPNAPSGLQVSEPIVEWAQIRPERKLHATAYYTDTTRKKIEVTAVVSGIASGTGDNDGYPESSPAQAPRVYFSLLRRRTAQGDELPGSEVIYEGPQIGKPGCGHPCGTWTATFRVTTDEFNRHAWSVFAEEVERMRPATYADEPRYQTMVDSNFVDTGPQFAARLALDNLMPRLATS